MRLGVPPRARAVAQTEVHAFLDWQRGQNRPKLAIPVIVGRDARGERIEEAGLLQLAITQHCPAEVAALRAEEGSDGARKAPGCGDNLEAARQVDEFDPEIARRVTTLRCGD